MRVVEVGGVLERLDRSEIQRTVVDAIDGGFFSCDMQKLRQAVVAMPWVADVSIRRVWPDKLNMVVTEQVPMARWGDDNRRDKRARHDYSLEEFGYTREAIYAAFAAYRARFITGNAESR